MTPLTPTQELNTQIAERVMGWTNIHWSDYGELYAATPESAPGRTRIHLFTDSLDAVARAERALRRDPDAWRRYGTELASACLFFPSMPTAASLDRLMTADALTRCRAMVAALTPLGRHALSDSGGGR